MGNPKQIEICVLRTEIGGELYRCLSIAGTHVAGPNTGGGYIEPGGKWNPLRKDLLKALRAVSKSKYRKMRERAEKSEARVTKLEVEGARLDNGWYEANGRVLEVGLERTQLRARVAELEAERQSPAISPNPFRLNPVDGTMGYLLVSAMYTGELDEWIVEDEGEHKGWRMASPIESDQSGKGGS